MLIVTPLFDRLPPGPAASTDHRASSNGRVKLQPPNFSPTYGIVTLFFQKGYGSQAIFNTHSTGAIIAFIPLLAFAFLFGLSMDYEVFLLRACARNTTRPQTPTRLSSVGCVEPGDVTAAALILMLAFAALASASDTPVRVFANALGAGILIDATVVCAVLVPAIVSLMGRWNWWMPTPLARGLRIESVSQTWRPRRSSRCLGAVSR